MEKITGVLITQPVVACLCIHEFIQQSKDAVTDGKAKQVNKVFIERVFTEDGDYHVNNSEYEYKIWDAIVKNDYSGISKRKVIEETVNNGFRQN